MYTGQTYITFLHMCDACLCASPAMRQLNDHACDWLLTIDCLVHDEGLSLEDTTRAADRGFRGEDVQSARRFLMLTDTLLG